MGLKNKSITSALEISKQDALKIFQLADKIKMGKVPKLKGKIALLFFEPSTRTFFSFYSAALLTGLTPIGFQSIEGTSVKKGESLIDTVRMFLGYGADCIVMRHPRAGAPLYIAERIDKPVINAGDDSREHPTQGLLDVYTIRERFGKIDGLRIGILGDLRYGRTPSSLAYLLSHWDTELVFIAPPLLQIDKRNDGMEMILRERDVKYEKREEVRVEDLDVLYVTRIQRERFPDEREYLKVRGAYRITRELLNRAKKDMIVMHPLPRVDELSPEVDRDERAWYFRQAENGLYVRAALFSLILGGWK